MNTHAPEILEQSHGRDGVFEGINTERDYQDKKWGTIEEHPHTVGEWLLVMQGELDEAIRAWQKGVGDTGALQEIIQVVAVGVACMEQHGVYHQQSHIDTLYG